jgi:hypothetical protein
MISQKKCYYYGIKTLKHCYNKRILMENAKFHLSFLGLGVLLAELLHNRNLVLQFSRGTGDASLR